MPQNLTEEEINSLAVRAGEGDDEAMAKLVAVIMPAAKARASKFNSDFVRVSDEDLTQEGMLGFLEAVKKYDISKGVPFAAFAGLCIKNRMISALRENSNSGNVALTTAISIDDSDADIFDEDPISAVISGEESAKIFAIIENDLTDFEKSVILMRFNGDKYDKIAVALGCSAKSVDNAIQRIRKKIRSKM